MINVNMSIFLIGREKRKKLTVTNYIFSIQIGAELGVSRLNMTRALIRPKKMATIAKIYLKILSELRPIQKPWLQWLIISLFLNLDAT